MSEYGEKFPTPIFFHPTQFPDPVHVEKSVVADDFQFMFQIRFDKLGAAEKFATTGIGTIPVLKFLAGSIRCVDASRIVVFDHGCVNGTEGAFGKQIVIGQPCEVSAVAFLENPVVIVEGTDIFPVVDKGDPRVADTDFFRGNLVMDAVVADNDLDIVKALIQNGQQVLLQHRMAIVCRHAE